MLTTVTQTSLLEGLRDLGNQQAWDGFVGRYRPIIVGYAQRRGLAPEDAEDAAQAALLEFTKAWRDGRYDREKGRLRAWLHGIAHHQIENLRRRGRRPEVQSPETSGGVIEEAADTSPGPEAAWAAEWRDAVLRQCLDEVRREVEPRTYEAFHLFVIEDRPASEVARQVGITPNAVFLAKRRILRRARELVPFMDGIW